MAAQFVVISDEGKLFLRECVRIAKKSLIMSQPVDGKTQIPKERCYYYDPSKEKALSKAVIRLEKRRRSVKVAQQELEGVLTKVVSKSTRF